MATPRKRQSSGFTSPAPEPESSEKEEVLEFLDSVAAETLENIEKQEARIEEIVPTEDPGPRFVEKTESAQEPQKTVAQPPKPPAALRHPRNIPRFSRYK